MEMTYSIEHDSIPWLDNVQCVLMVSGGEYYIRFDVRECDQS